MCGSTSSASSQERLRVPPPRGVRLARGLQLIQGVHADGLQQPEARFAGRVRRRLHKTVLDQSPEPIQDAVRCSRVSADLLGCRQRPSAGEDAQRSEQALFDRLEQVVAPGDRCRAAHGGARARRGVRPVSTGSRCCRRSRIAAGGSTDTRAAASSSASGSPSNRRQMATTARCVLGRESEVRLRGLRPLDEQRHGRRRCFGGAACPVPGAA